MAEKLGIAARLRRAYAAYTLADLDRQMNQAISGQPTLTGVSVDENGALNYTAVYACVRVRAEALSSLSLHLYRRSADGKGSERAVDQKLYHLLHDAPNEEMTAVEMLETAQSHFDTWGNAYIWLGVPKVGRNAGYIQSLYPLKPDKVVPRREGGRLKYDYTRKMEDGSEKPVTYDVTEVLHVPALGYDGLIGYSPVGMARQAIGMGLALEEFGARYFGQGTHPAGVLSNVNLPPGMNLEAFQKYIQTLYAGLGKTHSVMTTTGDAKYTPLTIPMDDAQFLATRKFQLAEIARMYRVPLHLIAELDKATFSNIEMQALEFAMFTMMPLAKKWEKKMNLRLLTEREREQGYYFEFDMKSLMRGDNKSRAEFYKLMREVGAMNPNEIREAENLNPREGGDEYWDQGPSGQGGPGGAAPADDDADDTDDKASKAEAMLRPVFADAQARMHKREQTDILASAERYAKGDEGLEGFVGSLESYWPKHREFCATVLRPAYAAMGCPERADLDAGMRVGMLQLELRGAAADGIDGIRRVLSEREGVGANG